MVGEVCMIYLKITIASVIIALSIPISIISAFLGEPWDHPGVVEVYYLFFCFFRNITIYMILLKIKTGLLLASIYSVFVAINLFFAIVYGKIEKMRDIWNETVISPWRGFWNTVITGMVLYLIWIILLVINEYNYFNNKELR
jgi:hypothetical protein